MCGFYAHNTNVEMSIERFTDILDQASTIMRWGRKTDSIRIDGNAEALLYRNLGRAIEEARKRFPRCTMATNGTLLSEEVAKEILSAGITDIDTSVTGITAKVYQRFQGYGLNIQQAGIQLDSVAANVERFQQINKKGNFNVNTYVSYILTEESLCDAAGAAYFWKSRGVSWLKYYYLHSCLGKNEEINKLYEKSAGYQRANACFGSLTIYANGDVAACCNDCLRATVAHLGNVFKESLSEILASERYNAFVNNLRTFNMAELPVSCQKCDLIKKRPAQESEG
jgi:MoaA/NifB/PqqE/SkfB family radical SAM enzyme